MLVQSVSILGALLILAAYAGSQRNLLDRDGRAYNVMNLLGAAILTAVAFRAEQWGFVLLEGAWTILSVPPLLRQRRA